MKLLKEIKNLNGKMKLERGLKGIRAEVTKQKEKVNKNQNQREFILRH